MTTLREAAQQALEALEYDGLLKKRQAIAALRAALAQQDEPVQEPVAWMESPHGAIRANPNYKCMFPSQLLHWRIPLYTAPPQRKPLAESQINDLMAGIDPEDLCSWSFRQGVYAAEKHHGVKL